MNIYYIYGVINKLCKLTVILCIIILLLYLIIYTIYFLRTDCDDEKKFNLDIYNICPVSEENSKTPIDDDFFKEHKEVYHIDNQNLTYKQAQEKCKSYNSELATKEQMIMTYNKGAHWCNYGWIKEQEAYYPVQKCILDDDKNNKNKKCGKPGLNGGYFSSPDIKFGANCYGKKPSNKNIEIKSYYCDNEDNNENKPFCEDETNAFSCGQNKYDYISPFNNKKWSMY